MTEKLTEHPLLLYITFILPLILLVIAIATAANVFLLIIILAWLGIAFVMLFLPIEKDNGSSS